MQFVEELREDSSAVSKGRLMSMHLRMQGMRTRNGDKELISLYRGRNRDLWPIGLQQQYATEQRQEREREASNRRAMDSWDVQDEPMTERQIQAAQRQLDDVQAMADAYLDATSSMEGPGALIGSQGFCPEGVTDELRHNAWALRHSDGRPYSAEEDLDSASTVPVHDAAGPPYPFPPRTKTKDTVELNEEQRYFSEVYTDWLEDVSNEDKKPPPIVLLHGMAGTGKSTVIDVIVDNVEEIEALQPELSPMTARMAFNHINALAMRGKTIASVIHLNNVKPYQLSEMGPGFWQQFVEENRYVKLIILDEISNVAPYVLAHIDYYFQRLTGNFSQPFGGIRVLLVGDLNQLGPVRQGVGLARAVMEMHTYLARQKESRGTKRSRSYTFP